MPVAVVLKWLSYLPLSGLHALGVFVGWFLRMAPNRARRRARENIARCFPELSTVQQQRLVNAALVETAKAFFETAALWNWEGSRVVALVKEVIGGEYLDQAVAKERGVIVVMPHLGSWELATIYCSYLQPMTTLYKPPRLVKLEQMMLAGRQRLGAVFMPTDTRGVRAVYQALGKRQVVGILPDQNPTPGAGIYAPFFGYPTYTITLVGRLLQRTDAQVVYAFAQRLSGGNGFRLHFRAPLKPFSGLGLEQMTSQLNADIEACIREVPAQYQWTYPRFKFTPEELAKHIGSIAD